MPKKEISDRKFWISYHYLTTLPLTKIQHYIISVIYQSFVFSVCGYVLLEDVFRSLYTLNRMRRLKLKSSANQICLIVKETTFTGKRRMVRMLCMGKKLLINKLSQNEKKNECIIQKHNYMQDVCTHRY